MKKGFFLSIAVSVSLFGGDYGYREFLLDKKEQFIALDEISTVTSGYMPSDAAVVNYCLIKGGNMYGTFVTDLGKESIQAIGNEDYVKLQSMSFEQRKDAYFKKQLDLKYTPEYSATLRGDNYKGKHARGVQYECKNPSGTNLFSAIVSAGVGNYDHWIVEHPKEQVYDNANYIVGVGLKDSNMLGQTFYEGTSIDIQKKLAQQYPTVNSFFDDWNNGFLERNNKQKSNEGYRMLDSFDFDRKFGLTRSMGELTEVQYFCEAHNGTFTKDGQSFRKFLKDFYKGGAVPADFTTSPLEGTYLCIDSKEPFSLELKGYKPTIESKFNLSYALIKKGANTSVVAQPKMVMNPTERTFNTPISSSDSFLSQSDEKLIRKTTVLKIPYGEQQGSNVATALYNGMDAQGCHLVALQKTVANIPVNVAPKNTYNYKVCNGQITALGETGMPGVPRAKEFNPIIAQVKNQCKAYGAYGSEYQGTVVSCRTLDQNHCNIEITIMQNGMMVDKQVENTCK